MTDWVLIAPFLLYDDEERQPVGGHHTTREENDTRERHEGGDQRRYRDQGGERKNLNGSYTPTRPPSKRSIWRTDD